MRLSDVATEAYGFVGPGMSRVMHEFPELHDLAVIFGLFPPAPTPIT
jgi:hypothetical protein